MESNYFVALAYEASFDQPDELLEEVGVKNPLPILHARN